MVAIIPSFQRLKIDDLEIVLACIVLWPSSVFRVSPEQRAKAVAKRF